MLKPSDYSTQQLEGVIISSEINNILNEIDISGDDQSLFNENAYSSLIQKLNELLDVHSQYEIIRFEISELQWGRIQECIRWAHQLWQKSIESGDVTGSVLAVSIIDYFFFPIKHLDTSNFNDKFRSEIEKLVPNLKFNIPIIDTEIDLNQEYYDDYMQGVKEKNYIKILTYIDSIERRKLYRHQFQGSLLKVVTAINSTAVTELLTKYEPIQCNYILECVGHGNILPVLSNYSSNENIFPLIRGVILLAIHYDSLIAKEYPYDEVPYEAIYNLLRKLLDSHEMDNPIQFLMDIGRLRTSAVFNSVCGIALGKDIRLSSEYAENIDFEYEVIECGELFYKYFLDTNRDEKNKEDVITRIAQKYFKFLSENEGIYQINRYTSYHKCIFDFFRLQIFDSSSYLNALDKCLKDILDLTYSWNYSGLYALYSKFYFLIVLNVSLGFQISDSSIPDFFDFLNDDRYKPILGEKIIEFLKKCLLSPATVDKITMSTSSHDDSAVELTVTRKNKA